MKPEAVMNTVPAHALGYEGVAVPEFPQRIELELVSDCNLECVYCPRHFVNELTGYIDFDLFKRLIDEMAPFPEIILVLHRRGESLLHPQFAEICRYIRGKFKEVQLATNVTPLTEKKALAVIEAVDFISFSIDTPEHFNRTRLPAKYDDVEAKIMRFLDLNRDRVTTQVSMVQTQETRPEDVAWFHERWQNKVNRVRVYQEHSTDGNFGSIKGGRSPRKPCMMPLYEMLIYCDGKTGRCNHDWDGPPMGDVTRNTIREIWMNEAYARLREEHRTLKINDPVCAKCDSWYPAIGVQGTGQTFEKAGGGS
jgi:radical SAM protein with 4Fe4S-binding SPASM domain